MLLTIHHFQPIVSNKHRLGIDAPTLIPSSTFAVSLQPDVFGDRKVYLGKIAPPQHIALGITYLIDTFSAQCSLCLFLQWPPVR